MIVPTVEDLLGVDREFRRARLEALRTSRGSHRYSAFFSSSALAERMRRQRDWVVIALEDSGENPLWSVVTEWRGIMKGKRVVRGRELECFEYYRDRIRRRAVA